jgi:hypothetical protein
MVDVDGSGALERRERVDFLITLARGAEEVEAVEEVKEVKEAEEGAAGADVAAAEEEELLEEEDEEVVMDCFVGESGSKVTSASK